MPYFLALDQGTTSSRAVIFDETGEALALGRAPVPLGYPRPGWVEQHPEDLIQSVLAAARDALQAAELEPEEISAIGLTNQRETTLVWDKRTGEPLAPAIVWQDRRTAPLTEALKDEGHEAWVRERTGLFLDPYFSASKLAWALKEYGLKDRARLGEVAFGTVDSWLIYRLTGAHLTDATNAARTLLYNLRTLAWDEDLLALFDIPRSVLPEVRPSFGPFGTTDFLGAPVPITAVLGDQQAALFGQAALVPGRAKHTYGTGGFLVAQVEDFTLKKGVLTTLAWLKDNPAYALEGAAFVAGALIEWLVEGLGLFEGPAELETLAANVPDSGDVVIVPAHAGLGSPHWDPTARGLIIGLTRGTNRAHLARAALEALAWQTAELAGAMGGVDELRVDGGGAKNDLLLQLTADALGVPVRRAEEIERTALGAALAAGVGAGLLDFADVERLWCEADAFFPELHEEKRKKRLARWQAAVERAKGWAR